MWPLTWSIPTSLDFPGGSDSKASVYNAGDPGAIPGSGRSPREGNGKPLQHSCLGNPMDRGGLQFMGLQRVRHKLVTKQQQQQKIQKLINAIHHMKTKEKKKYFQSI